MATHRRPQAAVCRVRTPRSDRRVERLGRGWVVLALIHCAGCTTLGFGKKDDEYDLARRAVESYSDADGNFIRPEGRSADKRRQSDLPGPLKHLQNIGTRQVNQSLAKEQYAEAEKLFEKASELSGDERTATFIAAAKQFDEAGKNWVSSYLQQDSLMMAAVSYFFAEKYPQAEDRYSKLIKEYPRTKYQDRVDRRRMEIGQFWLGFEDKFYNVNFTDKRKPWNDTAKHGVRVLEKMRLDSPTGELADDATMQLATNNFNKQKWPEALNSFDELISAFPDSKHLYQAHFLGIKSALLSYRGPDYSQEPLEYASKYFKGLRHFGEEARKDKAEIDSMYTELLNRQAERFYHNAVYRFNKGEAKASRLQCEKVLLEFGNTSYAEPARELMKKLENMPDEPTPYLSELAKLFPDEDKTKELRKPLPEHVRNARQEAEMQRTARALGTDAPATDGSTEGLIYR